jgi:hypothetical protein
LIDQPLLRPELRRGAGFGSRLDNKPIQQAHVDVRRGFEAVRRCSIVESPHAGSIVTFEVVPTGRDLNTESGYQIKKHSGANLTTELTTNGTDIRG